MKTTTFFAALILTSSLSYAGCPTGAAPTTYGTNNVWIGYVFDGTGFDTYKGYVNEGTSSSPNFDESFGGSDVNYNTVNGCPVETETFSVRYKLNQTFTNADYTVIVGADDGYRLSVDGGATWVINNWNLQSYVSTTQVIHLNGSSNLVLEYYENGGDNRVSFNITKNCTPSGNPLTYGSSNQWIGYVYSGMNFDTYKGYVFEGNATSANFDESFGGDNVSYGTSDCPVTTNQFSMRYRLNTVLTSGVYQIIVGADDGYRLSLDGGSTYIINKWNDQGYSSTTYTATLSGTYNMVLDYYENGGSNRVSFTISGGTTLPVTLSGFKGEIEANHQVDLSWATMMEKDIDHYEIQRSADGFHFTGIGTVPSQMTTTTNDYQLNYHYTDLNALPGTSYYRVKVIGKDNYTNQSPIVQISNNQIEGTKIFPTLIQNNMVFVETDKTLRGARIEFFDLSGKKLSETNWESLNGRQNCQVSKSGSLPSGTYLARLTANGQTIKNQLMIVQAH
jgi:hypothetical protein